MLELDLEAAPDGAIAEADDIIGAVAVVARGGDEVEC